MPLDLAEDVQAMCEAYEQQIEQWGGVDLQLLGIGTIMAAKVPGSILQFHPDVVLICDEAAYPL